MASKSMLEPVIPKVENLIYLVFLLNFDYLQQVHHLKIKLLQFHWHKPIELLKHVKCVK